MVEVGGWRGDCGHEEWWRGCKQRANESNYSQVAIITWQFGKQTVNWRGDCGHEKWWKDYSGQWADESNYSQVATITLQFGKQTVHLHVEMHAWGIKLQLQKFQVGIYFQTKFSFNA